MFGPITIPYESVMMYNVARLKQDIDFDDVEFAVAEMCSLVKETYPDFIAGQVFRYEGLFQKKVVLVTMVLREIILQLSHTGNHLRHMKKVIEINPSNKHFQT